MVLTNLANFDPIGKFMEQNKGKCARSEQNKFQGNYPESRGNRGAGSLMLKNLQSKSYFAFVHYPFLWN